MTRNSLAGTNEISVIKRRTWYTRHDCGGVVEFVIVNEAPGSGVKKVVELNMLVD